MNLNFGDGYLQRFAVIGNVKDLELEAVDSFLYDRGIKFDAFDDLDGTIYYIEVADRDEYNYFKDITYRELKKSL